MGSNVRTIRERLGITQEDLALKSGLTQGYINFLENGKRGYSEKSLEKIANALRTQISGLFEEKIKEEPTIVAEQPPLYGKRRRTYDTIINLLEKLPAPVIDHYKILLEAEVEIRNRGSVD
ncbi:MAG TPA: helix-turn-helix domain-containing protein [Candidatus Wunengus californicus]|uniref:helix-turn-helix domain-containing protein n=1 Tax=Candidatus Wunengus californicus TaxID=3367619 RepID=UPI0040286AC3